MRYLCFSFWLATTSLGVCLTSPVLAGTVVEAATLEKLLSRLEKLESRNAALEAEVKALKSENERVNNSLNTNRISEEEPEMTARLKAVEQETLDMKKAVKKIEGLEGLKATANLATVIQQPSGLPSGTQYGGSQLNYRADVAVELPLAPISDTEQKLFAHFRMGQGLGLNRAFSNLGHFGNTPNALAFRASGANPDDSVAILGQAWYQAAIPLPFGGFKPRSRETLELTFGKMDIFGFFDQNAASSDETRQFLNSVFVHNPLLDAGREVGVDANGFQPGFIAAYVNRFTKAEPWRLSIGVFGSGSQGASYQRSLSAPLTIAQIEQQTRFFEGLPGHYRLYAWNRSEAPELDQTVLSQHTGLGLSMDQRAGDDITLFARYGKQLKGQLTFNQAMTAGFEWRGSPWHRAADAIGFAAGSLKTSPDYKSIGGSGDLVGDGSGIFHYTPGDSERLFELYYRYRISPQFALSPDLQWIERPGGNPEAKSIKVLGLRANLNF